VGVRVCSTRPHTHIARRGARCEPRGQAETLGGPEESRWKETWQICIRMCTKVLMCIYMLGGGMISEPFSFNIFSFRKSEAKDVIVKARTDSFLGRKWLIRCSPSA